MSTLRINNEVLSFDNIYYCDSNIGNDNNNGLSGSTPLKTIQAAIDKIPINSPSAIVLMPSSIFEGEKKDTGFINIPVNTSIYFIGRYTATDDIPIIRSTDRNCIQTFSALTVQFINIKIESLGESKSGGAHNYASLLNCRGATSELYFYNCYLMPRGVVFNSGGTIKIYNSIIDYNNHYFAYELFHYGTGVASGNKTVVNSIMLGKMTCRVGVGSSNIATFTYSIVSNTNLSYHTLTDKSNKRLETDLSSIDDNYKILLEQQYWEHQGEGFNYDGSVAHIGMYGGPYALNIIFNKYFVFHNNLYKTYDTNTATWFNPINNIPTITDYNEYGMEVMPVNNLSDLKGSKSIVTYFDDLESKTATIKFIPKPVIITSDNIMLSDIHEIQSITLTATEDNGAHVKLLSSPDNGSTWYAYKDEQWSTTNNIKEEGNTITEFNNIKTAFNSIINLNDKKLMFKFHLELFDINDSDLKIDKLSYKADLKGTFKQQTVNINYTMTYATNNVMQINITEPGNFKVNY